MAAGLVCSVRAVGMGTVRTKMVDARGNILRLEEKNVDCTLKSFDKVIRVVVL